MKKILFIFVIMFCCTSILNAQMIVPYVQTMEKFGFSNYKRERNVFYFSYEDIVVTAAVDNNSNIINSVIAFDKKYSNTSAIFDSTYITYAFLQTQLKKDSVFDPKVGARKMKYLFQTLKHNLEKSNRTEFNFDDLRILAIEKNGIVYLNMKY